MEEKAHQWLAVSTHLTTFIWRCIDYFPITSTSALITFSGTLSAAHGRKLAHITTAVALDFQTAKLSTLAIQQYQTTTVNYSVVAIQQHQTTTVNYTVVAIQQHQTTTVNYTVIAIQQHQTTTVNYTVIAIQQHQTTTVPDNNS